MCITKLVKVKVNIINASMVKTIKVYAYNLMLYFCVGLFMYLIAVAGFPAGGGGGMPTSNAGDFR